MKIALHYRKKETELVEPLLRAMPYLAGQDVLVIDKGESDPEPRDDTYFFVQQYFLTKKILDSEIPTIMLERNDSANSWCRRELRYPVVRKVVKAAILRDWRLNNLAGGRYHSHLLGARTPEPDVLNEVDAAKLIPGATFAHSNRMSWWQTKDFLQTTKVYDCHFAGSVEIYNKEINQHRREVIELLGSIPGKHFFSAGTTLSREEYNLTLGMSKLCISPWGWGELTYRDFEAIHAGAVLIKPNSDFVLCWPDMMKSGQHYVACSPDWSDLPEVIKQVLDSWDTYEEMRYESRKILLQHWSNQEIGMRYQSIFESAFGKADR